jgi:hypothetical protein
MIRLLLLHVADLQPNDLQYVEMDTQEDVSLQVVWADWMVLGRRAQRRFDARAVNDMMNLSLLLHLVKYN